MSVRSPWISSLASTDKILLLAIVFAVFSGAQGISWGVYSCLNPDQMALRWVKSNPPLHPGSFDKPPLLTYINNVLVNEPTKLAAQLAVLTGTDKHDAESTRQRWRTFVGRLLQSCFFAGIVLFAYFFARDWFGLASARVTALLLGTCSGLVPYKIFLTADMSLVFWMVACLYCCGKIMRNPDFLRVSLLAGSCAGLATATKYNGLVVAIALPLAYFLAPGGLRAAFRRKSFYLCGLAVPLSFIVANPYCILDAGRFTQDFMFNYTVTPVYSGETGTGYGKFIARLPEIFGRPLTWIMAPVAAVGFWSLRGDGHAQAKRAMALLAAVALFYFWKIGSFPRMETRFVLPVAPFMLLMVAPGWQLLAGRPSVLTAIVAPLCLYGLVSGWVIGGVFAQDARMAAIDWARKNFPSEASVETAGSCPKWKFLEGRRIEVREFPEGMTRDRIFREKLGANQWVNARVDGDKERKDSELLTAEELRKRSPNFITIDSFYIGEKDVAPFVRELIAGKLGYRVVFEEHSPSPPSWAYPQHPDFTGGTFYILARQ